MVLESPNKVYRLIIKTGDVRLAGTDANIYAKLDGSTGGSGTQLLDHPNENNFERGDTDEFDIHTGDLGELNTLLLFRDNYGPNPGWFLEEVG